MTNEIDYFIYGVPDGDFYTLQAKTDSGVETLVCCKTKDDIKEYMRKQPWVFCERWAVVPQKWNDHYVNKKFAERN